MTWKGEIRKIDDLRWEIPKDYKKGMRVPARIYADSDLLNELKGDLTLEQATNVAFLQGIYKYSVTLPDGHQGYTAMPGHGRAKVFPSEGSPQRTPKPGS